jgi:hypothetical protein
VAAPSRSPASGWGDGLAQAAPYLLLLSATPHQGMSDAFRRLIGFLDVDALPDDNAISREAVAPFVIRTEKRRAIDADGNPLFKPRVTQLVRIKWGTAHTQQRALYEAVIEPASRDTERLAQPTRRPDPPVLRNETELHVDSFAK